jgi:protein TonB
VVDVMVTDSVPLLDQAAVDAVRQWVYAPTLVNGQPAAVILNVAVAFTLDDTPAPFRGGR